jgi:hypothetical protein
MTDWPQRSAAVQAADCDDCEALHEAYEADWMAAYSAAFRATAAARGWSAASIESGWLDDMPAEAFLEHGPYGTDPATQAATDVKACENEAWGADA